MGLFDKKYCDICGEKIGLLGNRKLENGNCCKNCAAKLSPWFSERRHSTVEDIKGQLEYREENKKAVAVFHPDKQFGEGTQKLMIDVKNRKFTIASASDLKNGNPDILDLSDITSVNQDNRESKTEQKRKDKDGKMVSYVPAKYKYSYDFYIQLTVRHPYIDDMQFRLNSSTVELDRRPVGRVRTGIFADYAAYVEMSDEVSKYMEEAMASDTQSVSEEPAADSSPDYSSDASQDYSSDSASYTAQDTSDFAAEEKSSIAAAAPSSAAWTCPGCTAENTGAFCEFCGTPRP